MIQVQPHLLPRPPDAAPSPPSTPMLLRPSPPPPFPIRKSATFPPKPPVAPLHDGAAPAKTRAPPLLIACMAPSSPFSPSGRCVGPPKRPIHEWVTGFFGNDEFLQCGGGIGMALLSTTTSVAKSRICTFLAALAANPTFVSGLLAWALAQSMKLFLNFFVERKWDFGVLVSSGGMPSSHSALCTALTTSVALCHGVADSLFPVCLGFSLIVMYDATGVRRHAGMQAEVLNVIIEDLFQGHPISKRKLKELLGHTPSQVIAGAFLGVLVACFCCQGGTLVI